MQFQSEVQREAYGRLATLLQSLGVGVYPQPDDEPGFIMKFVGNSSKVVALMVQAEPFVHFQAMIAVRAVVLQGLDLDGDRLLELLGLNGEMNIGGLSASMNSGVVWHNFRMIADTLDETRLRAAIFSVAGVADSLAEELQPKWGGLRAGETQQ
jgi:hypothetical protein